MIGMSITQNYHSNSIFLLQLLGLLFPDCFSEEVEAADENIDLLTFIAFLLDDKLSQFDVLDLVFLHLL